MGRESAVPFKIKESALRENKSASEVGDPSPIEKSGWGLDGAMTRGGGPKSAVDRSASSKEYLDRENDKSAARKKYVGCSVDKFCGVRKILRDAPRIGLKHAENIKCAENMSRMVAIRKCVCSSH